MIINNMPSGGLSSAGSATQPVYIDSNGDAVATTYGLDMVTTSKEGLMSAADKTKLNGIAAGATANTGTVTSVSISGTSPITASGTVTSSGSLSVSHAASGATAGTYGSATTVPQITVNSSGHITGVSNKTIQSGGVSWTNLGTLDTSTAYTSKFLLYRNAPYSVYKFVLNGVKIQGYNLGIVFYSSSSSSYVSDYYIITSNLYSTQQAITCTLYNFLQRMECISTISSAPTLLGYTDGLVLPSTTQTLPYWEGYYISSTDSRYAAFTLISKGSSTAYGKFVSAGSITIYGSTSGF